MVPRLRLYQSKNRDYRQLARAKARTLDGPGVYHQAGRMTRSNRMRLAHEQDRRRGRRDMSAPRSPRHAGRPDNCPALLRLDVRSWRSLRAYFRSVYGRDGGSREAHAVSEAYTEGVATLNTCEHMAATPDTQTHTALSRCAALGPLRVAHVRRPLHNHLIPSYPLQRCEIRPG
jgi:hypothetical protein